MKIKQLSLAKQLTIMFVGIALLAQLTILIIFFFKTDRRVNKFEELVTVRNITTAYQRVLSVPEPERTALAKLISNSEVIFFVSENAMASTSLNAPRFEQWFAQELDNVPVYRQKYRSNMGIIWDFWFSDEWEKCFQRMYDSYRPQHCPHIIYSLPLGPQQWLNAIEEKGPGKFTVMFPTLVSSLVTLVGITLITIVAVKRITRPIQDLSEAAEKLGRGEHGGRLNESGPKELAILTQAFNKMQERLIRFVHDRTKMLAAISHDLRTPITSLRLRTEFIEDEGLRDKMINTLEDMQTMVESLLTFAKQESAEEPMIEIDLLATLKELAEEFPYQTQLSGLQSCSFVCQQTSMRRAFRNLINNAIKYGETAHIFVDKHNGHIVISVQDNGAGIPEDKLTEIFEPIVRLDKARNTEQGSVGLGLSITRTIIHKHGGTIRAENGKSGLNVIIELPL